MSSKRSIIAAVVVSGVLGGLAAGQLAYAVSPAEQTQQRVTYQGKTIQWWAKRAVQARKDANARGQTIKVLRREIQHSPSVQEAVKLATMIYPRFSECRAWTIIKHESWMTRDPLHARNPNSSATGLYQFLVSTFNSTPFANLSMYSPYAQSLAAGWMHQNGRGGEWAIGGCR